MVRSAALATVLAAGLSGAAAAQSEPPELGAETTREAGPPLEALQERRLAMQTLLEIAWDGAVETLVAKMGVDPKAERAWRALQQAQEHWERHRNAACRGAVPALHEGLEARRASLSCEIVKNRARALELAERYGVTLISAE